MSNDSQGQQPRDDKQQTIKLKPNKPVKTNWKKITKKAVKPVDYDEPWPVEGTMLGLMGK